MPGYNTLSEVRVDGRNEERYLFTQATFDGYIIGEDKVENGILTSWVQTWLSAVYYKVLVKNKGFWVHLPAGDARPNNDKAGKHLLSNVPVVYPQNNLNLCLVKCFCSVFHYLGHHDVANELNNDMFEYMNAPLNMAINQLKKYMREKLPCLAPGRQFNFECIHKTARMRKSKKDVDICEMEDELTMEMILDRKEDKNKQDLLTHPLLVIPRGKDCGVGMLFV